nr:uncharacterized protein LOC109193957 isoform X2 [Ipomoea batatas]
MPGLLLRGSLVSRLPIWPSPFSPPRTPNRPESSATALSRQPQPSTVASTQLRRRLPPPSLPPSPLTVSAVDRRFCPGVSGRWSGSNSCVIVLYFEAERGTADIEERLELSQVKVRGFEHPGGMLL